MNAEGKDSGSDDEANALLRRAYSVETPDDSRGLYADWADTYDEDFIAATGYVYHQNVARLFVEAGGASGAAGSAVVADVGCGTGLVGVALVDLGEALVDGLDISPEMLAVAATKQGASGQPAYRSLIEVDLTTRVDIADDTYGGIISTGAFTHGHLGPEALDELIRIAAPNALAAIGINEDFYVERGFEQWLSDAVDAGRIIAMPTIEKVEIYGEFSGSHAARSSVALFRVR